MILKDRFWEVTVGVAKIANSDVAKGKRPLAVNFTVEKSLDREPNKARIEIFNLAKIRRESMEIAEEPELQIKAGYQAMGLNDVIFVGDSRDIYSQREGPDVKTIIEAEDGGQSYRTARFASSFSAGTALSTVITTLAGAMGVGVGNASAIAATATLDSGGAIFSEGLAIEGPVWRSLDTVCRSASLRWSVQNGVLQLRRRRTPTDVVATLISAETGMVGSPTRAAKDARTGDISIDIKTLMIPGIYPGKVVLVKSETVNGSYMVHNVTYTGSSTGADWYTDMTVKDYDVA